MIWKIDTFNSGENNGYFVVVISYLTLVWTVHNHGPNRRRGRTIGAEEKEKDHG
jgi:hypothetical protein